MNYLAAELTRYQNGHSCCVCNDIYVIIYDEAHKLTDPESFINDLKNTKYIADVIIIPGISRPSA